jgi:ribonuclease MRP protein subunit RMP1
LSSNLAPRQEEGDDTLNDFDSSADRLAGFRRAFTTLVADTQFSTLGVVLLAVLARVGRIVGLPNTGAEVPAANAGSKTLLASSVRETGPKTGEIVVREYAEDMGSVVERRAEGSESRVTDTLKAEGSSKESRAGDAGDQPHSNESSKVEEESISLDKKPRQNEIKRIDSQTKAKKRRKKGNAIDHLFGDLV